MAGDGAGRARQWAKLYSTVKKRETKADREGEAHPSKVKQVLPGRRSARPTRQHLAPQQFVYPIRELTLTGTRRHLFCLNTAVQ